MTQQELQFSGEVSDVREDLRRILRDYPDSSLLEAEVMHWFREVVQIYMAPASLNQFKETLQALETMEKEFTALQVENQRLRQDNRRLLEAHLLGEKADSESIIQEDPDSESLREETRHLLESSTDLSEEIRERVLTEESSYYDSLETVEYLPTFDRRDQFFALLCLYVEKTDDPFMKLPTEDLFEVAEAEGVDNLSQESLWPYHYVLKDLTDQGYLVELEKNLYELKVRLERPREHLGFYSTSVLRDRAQRRYRRQMLRN